MTHRTWLAVVGALAALTFLAVQGFTSQAFSTDRAAFPRDSVAAPRVSPPHPQNRDDQQARRSTARPGAGTTAYASHTAVLVDPAHTVKMVDPGQLHPGVLTRAASLRGAAQADSFWTGSFWSRWAETVLGLLRTW